METAVGARREGSEQKGVAAGSVPSWRGACAAASAKGEQQRRTTPIRRFPQKTQVFSLSSFPLQAHGVVRQARSSEGLSWEECDWVWIAEKEGRGRGGKGERARGREGAWNYYLIEELHRQQQGIHEENVAGTAGAVEQGREREGK